MAGKLRLPHPLLLLVSGVLVAGALTWVLPAGEYERRDDPATGRRIAVAGTYHAVKPAPVGPFAMAVSIPRGFVEGADVIAVVLLVGGAWVTVDRVGVLRRTVGGISGAFSSRGLWAIPLVSVFFAVMGGLENMQEEIIPLVPVLLALGAALGIDAVSVVGMSAGSAMIGSAFSPVNPFQAGIALKLAQLGPLSLGGVRLLMFVVAFVLGTGWTMRHAARRRSAAAATSGNREPFTGRDALLRAVALAPIAAYVYGALRLDWGFNELSGGFFIAGFAVGLLGGLGWAGTTTIYLEGMQALLPAAMLIGVSRSISLVLSDGHVIDTILYGLAAPLSHVSGAVASLLMIPFHAIVHVVVPSVSGQAALTMPIMAPLSDLLGISRQSAVLSYQTGAGLCELLTPTNGALMAVLLAAGVTFQRWFRFAIVGVALATLLGAIATAAVIGFTTA